MTNPGWTKTLVEQHGCGWYVPADDAPALAAQLRQVLSDLAATAAAGERGKLLAQLAFDRQQLARQMQGILEQAAVPIIK